MVIVEGPDGAGKSTLVQRLLTDLNCELIPRAVNSDAEITTDLCAWIDTSIERGFGRYIYDRHQLFSHCIYAPILKKTFYGKFQNPAWFSTTWRNFLELNPVIIFCLPPIEVVKANMEKDEFKVAAPYIESFYWQYYTWAHIHTPHRYVYDYTAGNAKEFYPLMVDQIRRRLFYESEKKKHG